MVTGCLVVVILVWLTPVSLLLLLRWKRVDSIVLRHDAADATGIACFEVNKQFCKSNPGCRCTPSPWPALSCFCRNVCITWSLLSLFAVSCQCTRRVCSPFPRPISQTHFPAPFAVTISISSPAPALLPKSCIFYAALHFDLAGLCLLVRYS